MEGRNIFEMPSSWAFRGTVILASCLLSLPVLVFNGPTWYPYIFLFKWSLVFGVVAYAFGFCAFLYMTGRCGVSLSFLEIAWLTLALFLAFQPFFIPLRSVHEWVRNWFFFASMGAAIFVLRNLPIDRALPFILQGITLVGAVSTLLGFLQVSPWNGHFPFVLDVSRHPGRFVGNTGLDNLLGAYLAFAIAAGFWLLFYAQKKGMKGRTFSSLTLALIAVNAVGLWRAAARSAFAACLLGLVVLFFSFRPSIQLLGKMLVVLLLLSSLLIFALSIAPSIFSVARRDMSQLFSAETLSRKKEGRFVIWDISWEMIRTAPVLGVGLGNYKWHYLDAMAAYRDKTEIPPRYTYWAHNEYLQWLAETGIVGVLLLACLLAYALGLSLRYAGEDSCFVRPWIFASLTILAVDSCFSRPFHHVETAFILPFALALLSRSGSHSLRLKRSLRLVMGGAALAVTALGLVLFAQVYSCQAYPGKYLSDDLQISFPPSEEGERVWQPFLLRDAFLQLIAKENYVRTRLEGDEERNQHDAIRLLERCFATQPRYEELNKLMLLYQRRGEAARGEPYLKYYPAEERQKFREGRFDGTYMED